MQLSPPMQRKPLQSPHFLAQLKQHTASRHGADVLALRQVIGQLLQVNKVVENFLLGKTPSSLQEAPPGPPFHTNSPGRSERNSRRRRRTPRGVPRRTRSHLHSRIHVVQHLLRHKNSRTAVHSTMRARWPRSHRLVADPQPSLPASSRFGGLRPNPHERRPKDTRCLDAEGSMVAW